MPTPTTITIVNSVGPTLPNIAKTSARAKTATKKTRPIRSASLALRLPYFETLYFYCYGGSESYCCFPS